MPSTGQLPARKSCRVLSYQQIQMAHANSTEPSSCCLCGQSLCSQTYDHLHTTALQAQNLIKSGRADIPSLCQLHGKLDSYYSTLLTKFKEMLEEDRNKVAMALRKLEFPWMTKERLNLELASQVYNGDFSMLPSRKLMPLLEALARPREDDMEVEEASDLEVVLAEKTTGESIAAKIELLKETLLFPLVKSQEERIVTLRKTMSIRKLRKTPQQAVQQNYSFQLKGVRCLQTAKEIHLNQKGITDGDLFQPVANMKHFPNLTGLQLRNNKITEISCRLIAVSLTNLQRLDIRGNKLRDQDVAPIAKRLTNLKELFVCDNELSDQAVSVIVECIKGLTLIWLQNNKVTYKGAELIITHDKIKAIGMMGNLISHQQASTLRHRYTVGYLSI